MNRASIAARPFSAGVTRPVAIWANKNVTSSVIIWGRRFSKAGLRTLIWTYDHNFNESPTADGDDPGLAYPRPC